MRTLLLGFLLTSISSADPTCERVFLKLNLGDEVEGLTLGNTHEVYKGEGTLLRGHEPGTKASELQEIGVTDVLIFKKEVKSEVKKEIKDLKALGYEEDRVNHIDMSWKDIKDPEAACKETVAGMNLMLDVAHTPGRKGYFHCTAGQDRTGMLAGLLEMALVGTSAQTVFNSKMCAHGYGFGDTKRPASVGGTVEKNLTPIFLQIASHLEGAGGAMKNVNPSVCSKKAPNALDPKAFSCKK